MKAQNLIALKEICINHDIEVSFIQSLQETGLVEVIKVKEDLFIAYEQLPQVERYIDFHYTLGINVEGIETISHLLQRMDSLQEELILLRNKLNFHEKNH